jgi:copper chaperone CopZ
MKKLILIALMLSSFSSYACEGKSTANLKVNGLVCDFCVRTLEKVFSTKSEVENIEVNLDAGSIKVNFKSQKTLSDEDLKTLITDSGYNITAIDRICK